jgi:hypothetical protein
LCCLQSAVTAKNRNEIQGTNLEQFPRINLPDITILLHVNRAIAEGSGKNKYSRDTVSTDSVSAVYRCLKKKIVKLKK